MSLFLPGMTGSVSRAGTQNNNARHAAFSQLVPAAERTSASLPSQLLIQSASIRAQASGLAAQVRNFPASDSQYVAQNRNQRNSSPTQKNNRQQNSSIEAQFEALRLAYIILQDDRQKSGLREPWLQLEKRFEALQKKSKGSAAAKAALYRAKTRDALARRSHNTKDYQEAIDLHLRVVTSYPKTQEAPEALLAAVQLSVYCKQAQFAKQCADRLNKEYPKSAEAQKAAALSVHWTNSSGKNETGEGSPAVSRATSPAQVGKTTQEASQNGGKVQTAKDASGTGKKQAPAILRSVHWNTSPNRVVCRLQFGADAAFETKILADEKPGSAKLQVVLSPASASKTVSSSHSPKDSLISQMNIANKGEGITLTFDLGKARWYSVQRGAKGSGNFTVYASMVNDIPGGQSVSGSNRVSSGGKTAAAASQGDDRGQKNAGKQPIGSVTLAEQLGLSVKTIMIDAGHGGKDPGAIGNGVVEKKFALTMAKKVGAQLKKHGFTVIYSRDKDVFIPLPDRPSLANTKKVDLFLSLHANANLDSSINGVETYYLDTAQTRSAQLVAARENAVNVNNISDLQFILSDLMLSSKLEESRDLARSVQRGILGRVKKSKYALNDNGVRSAPFYVLMGARMPAILIEFGYVTHSRDAENLKKEEFQNLLAEGVAQGVLAYKKKLEKYVPK